MPTDSVYLDYAATTPLDPAVALAMQRCAGEAGVLANASSIHREGRRAAVLVDDARQLLAELLNTDPGRLIWTSGATESDNLAIQGAARFRAHRGRHLVTMPTEHKAVLESFRALENEGFEVTWLRPGRDGRLDVAELEQVLREDTQLVSIMHVNNETGVIQDIEAIGALCRERDVLFHTDAAQSVGKLAVDLGSLPVDLLSLTAHKFYGPQGVGALYIADRPGCHVQPLMHGGGQEQRLRPGTLPVALIVGAGAAARMALQHREADMAHVTALRDRLWAGLAALDGVTRNGDTAHCYAGILNVGAEGVEGESLMLGLEPVCAASGSACNSLAGEPSFVLRALGRSDTEAQSAVRFSLGRMSTEKEVDIAIERYRWAVEHLRSIAPSP